KCNKLAVELHCKALYDFQKTSLNIVAQEWYYTQKQRPHIYTFEWTFHTSTVTRNIVCSMERPVSASSSIKQQRKECRRWLLPIMGICLVCPNLLMRLTKMISNQLLDVSFM